METIQQIRSTAHALAGAALLVAGFLLLSHAVAPGLTLAAVAVSIMVTAQRLPTPRPARRRA